MNWLPGKNKDGGIDPYYQISDDGRYTVCKIGGARGWTYEVFFGKQNLSVGHLTAESAKAHAESHAADLAKQIQEAA